MDEVQHLNSYQGLMNNNDINVSTMVDERKPLEKKMLINLVTSKNIYELHENFDISKLTFLDLSNCKLSSLNCAFKDLPLKSLNLSKNELTEVPQCFYSGLDILQDLDISHNKISKFEFEPNCCQTLKVLVLSNNLLKDIPHWILCLRATNLQELHYDFNKITSLRCIFDNSSNFSVRKLSMKNCIFREEDCKFLKEYVNLEELDISNSLNSTIYTNMVQNLDQLFIKPVWKNISILKLNNLSISLFPEGIMWLETLSELYMSHNDFIWLPTDGFEFLVNLEIMDLSYNCIAGIPQKLTWLEHLKVLKLNHNKLEIFPNISKMKSLEVLDLYYNNLAHLDSFSPNLKFLDLEFNYFNAEECDLVNYKEMRDNFRKTHTHLQRFNGYKNLSDCIIEESETDSGSSNFEDGLMIEETFSSESTAWEDWDEEIRLSNRHEDVTPSDDEWRGFEEDLIPKITKPFVPNNSVITYSEDVIFCDAD